MINRDHFAADLAALESNLCVFEIQTRCDKSPKQDERRIDYLRGLVKRSEELLRKWGERV